MGEADVGVVVGRVLAALGEAGRSEGTIRRHQVVLDRFAAFLAGRGLDAVSDQVCLDFIAGQTGTRLGALRESVRDKDVQAVRRPVVLMADALAGRAVVVDRSVIPVKDGCPARFRLLRDEYVVSCRARGNAEATVAAKDKAVSRFLGYLDEVGAGDLAVLGVRDVSGFLLRQRGQRRKTIAALRSCLADFLVFLAATGRAPDGLADRLPPHRHVRHESAPHPWTAEEVRLVLDQIDRQSAIGKRDYAMVLLTARLGVRVGDLRRLELGWFDWRAKTLAFTQHKTGLPLTLPLPGDVGWAVIDYVRHGRPEAACRQVFVKHRYPFTAFGSSTSAGCRLSYYARRAGIVFAAGRSHGLHSLRGALAVEMLQSDTPPPVVTAVLGHAAGTTTAAHYFRLDTEHLRRCALDVEDVLHAVQGVLS